MSIFDGRPLALGGDNPIEFRLRRASRWTIRRALQAQKLQKRAQALALLRSALASPPRDGEGDRQLQEASDTERTRRAVLGTFKTIKEIFESPSLKDVVAHLPPYKDAAE